MWWLPLWAGLAHAQDAFRPAIFGDRTLFTDDTTVGADGHPLTRVIADYSLDPLEAGGIDEDAATMHLMGGHTMGPTQMGAHIPVIGVVGRDGQVGVGDVSFDGKVALLRPGDDGVGASLHGGVSLPSATVPGYGRDGVGWRGGIVGEVRAAGFGVAANAGVEGGPAARVGDVVVDEQLYGALALSYANDRGGAALELLGRTDFTDPFGDVATSPAEVVLGGFWRFDPTWSLRAGVGAGLDRGLGATDGRVLVGMMWSPPVVRRTPSVASR